MGYCVLTKQQVLDAPITSDNAQQVFYRMLRKEGAPILGISHLYASPGYEFTKHCDTATGDIMVTWARRGH